MKPKSILLALALFAGSFASASTASAHHAHAVVVAPGVVVVPAPRVVRPAPYYCGVYGCSGTATVTGPYGNTATGSGSASCANGTCTRTGTVTGPYRSVTGTRTITRY
jgi:hypothetical protein